MSRVQISAYLHGILIYQLDRNKNSEGDAFGITYLRVEGVTVRVETREISDYSKPDRINATWSNEDLVAYITKHRYIIRRAA
jgi:hypothetical protein